MGYAHYTRTIDGLERHLGYAIRAECDHPDCTTRIDRGLGYLCGAEPGGDDEGCGRYFCEAHRLAGQCERCAAGAEPFPMKPDLPDALRNMEWHTPADEAWAVKLSAQSQRGRA